MPLNPMDWLESLPMHRRLFWFHLLFILPGVGVVAIAGYNALAAFGVALPGLAGAPRPSLLTCAILAAVGLLIAGQAAWQMRLGHRHNTLVDRLQRRGRRIDAVVERVERIGSSRSEDGELAWRITAATVDPALGGRRQFTSDTLWHPTPPAAPGDVVGVYVDPEAPEDSLFDELPPGRRR